MKIISGLLLLLLLASPAIAASKNTQELRQIAQAGGSLIIDLDRSSYSVSELRQIALSLNHGATLTIRTGSKSLSVPECLQIIQARPGHVRFWF